MFNEKEQMSSADNKELKLKLASLYFYISKRLGIKETPKIKLTNSQKNADKKIKGLTGYYDHTTKTIKVYITERHEIDVLRSFCHELIHHFQNERGILNSNKSSNNNQQHYAQNDLHLRKMEYQAFLLGSILFRDWQDQQKYGHLKIEPPLPVI